MENIKNIKVHTYERFFKFTLATIVGILVTGAVIVGFGIISLIGIWATSETETVVKNNSIYVLELKGIVSERSQENPFGQLFGDNTTVNGLDDIIESIKKGERKTKISKVSISMPEALPVRQPLCRRYDGHSPISRKAENSSSHTAIIIPKAPIIWPVFPIN